MTGCSEHDNKPSGCIKGGVAYPGNFLNEDPRQCSETDS